MKYQDISLEEFIALTQTHKVVIFGTGKLFQRAMPRLLSQGMKLDHIRLLMDNGSAGKNVTAVGQTWRVHSVEEGVRKLMADDIILITPGDAFAAIAEQLESYGLTNICCLYMYLP